LSAAIRGTTDGLWDWDIDAGEVWLAPRFMELLGFEPRETAESFDAWVERFVPEDRQRLQEAIQRHLHGREVFDEELRLVAADGSPRWFRARGLAAGSQDGALHHMAGSISDINQRKRAEASKERSRRRLKNLAETLERRVARRTRELEESNRDFQTFAYAASHDLKAPLRAVSGYVQMLEKRAGARSSGQEDVELIRGAKDNIDQMTRLIDGLLALSRVQRSREKREVLPLDRPLQRALSLLAPDIEKSGAMIIRQSPLPELRGDETQMTQLFQNLLSNALKFRGPQLPEIRIGAQRENGSDWSIWVRDNGIGFESRHAERIFEVFRRLHSPSEYAGTGIGLAICRKIVERHGGRIEASSKPGEGAEFRFFLPAATFEEDEELEIDESDVESDKPELKKEIKGKAAP
jgi:PAS domain S-box-containing protein